MASSSTLASRKDHDAQVLPQAESRELKDKQEDIPINPYQSDIDELEAWLKSGQGVEFVGEW
ncbi:hypothetical protein WOLCODRAFT_158823 [Wolfiporia cocos MD-104 SS10]|uniref:Uncharacterized protein n=1 Tax=Wolfiporia cocos (strain MD-104) TaxID=742152 RepID=A0A2H3JNF8_WOLCO|nr:hypothetical protein WOLCODRAFT_158823 [Wolfiporia cocos MD-104 SS10]